MRRTASILLSVSILFMTAVCSYAAELEVVDMDNNIIKLTAGATAGEKISVLITNPGFGKEDAIAGTEGAIQYFGTFTPDSENMEFLFQITGEAGGDFNAYITKKSGDDNGSITFYTSDYKKACIRDFNEATDDANEKYEALVKAFALENDELYNNLTISQTASAFQTLKKNQSGGEIPENITRVNELLKESFVLAAFNSARDDILFNNGIFTYTDPIALSDTDEYDDYLNSLSGDGVKHVNNALVERKYNNINEISDYFKELIHYAVIMKYKKSGYGHITDFLSKYEEAYKEAGIKLSSDGDRTLYQGLLDSGAKNLSELAEKYNDLEDGKQESSSLKPSRPGKGTRSGGGGSGSGSISSSSGSTDGSVQSTPSYSPFTDLKTSHWCFKPINEFVKKGYLNGYENGEFKPDDPVTRAEFVKIVLTALGIEKGGVSGFLDVAEDAWYAPYIAAAAKNGLIRGYGDMFSPNDIITRQDAAVILARYIGASATEDISFSDAGEIAEYAKDAVALLSQKSIVNGYDDNTFRPAGKITRAETVQVVYSLLEKGDAK